MRVPGGGASCLGVGRPGSGALPPPTTRPFGRAAQARFPLAVTAVCGRGGAAVLGTFSCAAVRCLLCALPGFAAPGGRCGLAPVGAHYALAVPSATPQRALLRAGFARCGGGMRVPGRGASCLGVGRPGSSALPPPTTRPFGRAAQARFPLAVTAVCGRGGAAVLGTFSCAAVRCLLCALPGFAAPGGRCGLAPVLVPWLWPAACLSGVLRGPALVRRASCGPVALSAPVCVPVAVVPSLDPGAVAPGFTGWLRGACGGRLRTGPFLPAAGPCRGKDAGLAPRHTRSGPRDGVVPGGSLRLLSWAACAAAVCVWGPGH